GLLQNHGDSGEWVVNRAADAQLAVDAATAGRRCRQEDASEQFVGRQLPIVVAEPGVELGEFDAANPRSAGNLDFRVQAEQRRRSVARKSRPALRAARCDVAEIAILLNAKAAGFSPLQRLVVPKAARVETDVPSDGAHVTQHGRSHCLCGLMKHTKMPTQKIRVLDVGERSKGADLNRAGGLLANAS